MVSRCSCVIASAALLVAGRAEGQVVQLPTFSSFSVSTTVSVPDRGAAYLGGVNRARYGSSTRGVPLGSKLPFASRLFRNRGIGYDVSSSGAWATATIIDHEEWDEALLAEAAARRGGEPLALSETDRKAGFLSRHMARHDTSELRASVEISRPSPTSNPTIVDIEAAAQANQARVDGYLERGRQAEEAGVQGAARSYYNLAVRRGNEAQQRIARNRLAAMAGEAVEAPLTLAARGD